MPKTVKIEKRYQADQGVIVDYGSTTRIEVWDANDPELELQLAEEIAEHLRKRA